MKNVFGIGLGVYVLLVHLSARAQTPVQTLSSFDKVITSPHVSVVLVAGEQETIELQYQNIEPEKVNYSVRHKTLRIYLDDARITVKNRKERDGDYEYSRPIYDKSVKVIAYVTYRQLKNLQIRGEEEAICRNELTSDRFKLRVYGQATVTLAGLKTNTFKAALYGENNVMIQAGQATRQTYRVYGENRLEAEPLTGQTVSAHAYGDNKLRVYAATRLGVVAFGESDIRYAGGARLRKGLVIGEVTIHQAE